MIGRAHPREHRATGAPRGGRRGVSILVGEDGASCNTVYKWRETECAHKCIWKTDKVQGCEKN